jgi:cyanophycinase
MQDFYKEDIGSHFLIIGGAEDKYKERFILNKFLSLTGGKESNILIIPVASDFPEVTSNIYSVIFKTLGAASVNILDVRTRQDVINIDPKKVLEETTGVFITGGDQMRICSTLGGTEFINILQDKVKEGLVLAGTSAGAAGFSSSMIVRGEPGLNPTKDSLNISPGLGILKNIIIDQHFSQRHRINRLIAAVCYNPKNLGIGIDEDTAILISKDGVLEVLGIGTVTIVDGSQITFNNIAEVEPDHPFSVFGINVHILSHSLKYNIYERKPLEVISELL